MRTYFWGVFLILSGIFLLIKYYFNLNISTGRVIIGLFLLLLGLFILIGDYGYSDDNNIIFRNSTLAYSTDVDEYNIIFSKGTLDLTGFSPREEQTEIEINSIFSDTTLILPKDAKVYVKASGAFAKTSLPDDSAFSFGDRIYVDDVTRENANLVINLSTVFANTRVEK